MSFSSVLHPVFQGILCSLCWLYRRWELHLSFMPSSEHPLLRSLPSPIVRHGVPDFRGLGLWGADWQGILAFQRHSRKLQGWWVEKDALDKYDSSSLTKFHNRDFWSRWKHRGACFLSLHNGSKNYNYTTKQISLRFIIKSSCMEVQQPTI